MKTIVYGLLILSLVACSQDECGIENYGTVTPFNIETSLKVVDLEFDKHDFDRMYENFSNEIEIEGLLNVYKNGVTVIENEPIEAEVKGVASAQHSLKTLGIKFDNDYNNESRKLIDPDGLPFHSLDNIKAFRLRNSGNDFPNTLIKDISYTELAIQAGLNLDLMYTEQVVVFVNHQFYGVMNLRTEGNTNGMAGLYNVEKEDVTLAKILPDGIVKVKDGDADRINRLISAIENEDYDYVSNEIDIDNFIDYTVYESYIGNRDWLYNNVRFFAIGNGPFRFVLFDLDLAATLHIDYPPVAFINSSSRLSPIRDLFNLMYANPVFKEQFDARLTFMINSGLLSSNKFNQIVDKYANDIAYVMPFQTCRHNLPTNMINWMANLEILKDKFAERECYVVE